MKDLKWLKEEVEKLDTEESQRYPHWEAVWRAEVMDLIDQVKQPELSVVPGWFAEWCEGRFWGDKIHEGGYFTRKDLNQLLEIADRKKLHGLTEEQCKIVGDNFFKYLNALHNGYTVEEKKYKVEDNHGKALLYKVEGQSARTGMIVSSLMAGEVATDLLTKEEIEGYDKKYMAFAEVSDVEESTVQQIDF